MSENNSCNIKVVVKVRPLISRELEQRLSYQWRVKNNTLHQVELSGRDGGTCFTFDKVYDKDTETSEVYDDVAKPIVEAAVAGFNGTIFAYGQTSSGKTYTMSGTEESPGIIPMAVLQLFNLIKKVPNRDFLVRVSYIEIYNETVKDLLNIEKEKIKVHDTFQGVRVDVTERNTASPEEVLDAMREGEANRQTGATNMNEESSRSHSIFQITIESREHVQGEEELGSVNVSQLNLVDLAGSERSGQTGATGIRFKEGTHINKSLSVLGLVIKQLSEDPNKHANYRDSKLTRILQNSLGGNAKTSIICAITPASIDETISTLQFANRAKAIKNKPEVNFVATNATKIHGLTKQLSQLQSQLESKKHIEQDNANLQKQIAALQKLILNGFDQASRMDMMGSGRRKWQQHRRVTISSLHRIEEDSDVQPAPPVPRFCTPALKYNPMSLSSESLPSHSGTKLSSVPELTRATTPPAPEKKAYFDGDIIELEDSDDDDSASAKSCSPYHKCYVSSKTPPCVLRKNAKLAEENLKDIVELTEREKIYTPSVVELLEKLEENTNVVSNLLEEVKTLSEAGKEKDSELELLRRKIIKTEEEVKTITCAKLELETRCKDYDIKLTDWEVSYETLKKKAKNREDELLSLLEDQKNINKLEDSKLATKPLEREQFFMDMSKDLSLVNSDNESSTANVNDDDSSTQIQHIVTDMQTQLTVKSQTINELEANIFAQRQKIESLENSRRELQRLIDSFKDKFDVMENENTFLKASLDNLNSTIQSQKVTIETANNDIQSYNSLIQELQIKLTNKENILNVKVNEAVLENMIANEEKFIANNENMKNIVQSFRMALNSRNKEIDKLKGTVKTNSDYSTNCTILKEQVKQKETHISTLIEEVEKLRDQLNDNIIINNKLMSSEQEVTKKLAYLEEQNHSLQKINIENVIHNDKLKENNDHLSRTIAEKEITEQDVLNRNKDLTRQIDDMSLKVIHLQEHIDQKVNLITTLTNENKDTQEYLLKTKSIVGKLQQILHILNSDSDKVPDEVDSLEIFFNVLNVTLNNLHVSAEKVVENKNLSDRNVVELKEQLSTLVEKHETIIATLQSDIDNLSIERNEIICRSEGLSQEIVQLTNELDEIRNEMDIKNREIVDLETKLNDTRENNENLRNDLLLRDNNISSLQDKVSSLCSEIQTLSRDKELVNTLKMEIDNLKANQDTFNDILKSKDEEIADLLNNDLRETEIMLEEKRSEVIALTQKLNDAVEDRNKILASILIKTSKLTNILNINNSMSCEFEIDNNAFQHIIVLLDKIANQITLIKSESEHIDIKEILAETKNEITELIQKNVKLMNDFSEIDQMNKELLEEMEKVKTINNDLSGTSELLQKLQVELKAKSKELVNMEHKAKLIRDQFLEFESIMKQQMDELQQENERLKDGFPVSEIVSKDSAALDYADDHIHNMPSAVHKSASDIVEINKRKSPHSLVTICCNRIRECIKQSDSDDTSAINSTLKSSMSLQNAKTQVSICECIKLSVELLAVKEENLRLTNALMYLESTNQQLIKEQGEVRKEVQLLLEPSQELQKKIVNHRTNLSTFTATTYAENKLLNSQLKVLKHHHTRYIHVCQRDIPEFKLQLHELMNILNGSTSSAGNQNTSLKRYSLPIVLDSSVTIRNLKNESTLDGDLLMLDTNVSLTTSADNTLVGHDQTCLDVSQVNLESEVTCQTSDLNKVLDPVLVYSQIETITKDNQNMCEKLEALREENRVLREQIDKYSLSTNTGKVDAQLSPIKVNGLNGSSTDDLSACKNCKHGEELQAVRNKVMHEVDMLSQELKHAKAQKEDIELKYANLTLEIPSTDALVRKLNTLEKEYQGKIKEIAKVNNDLNKKTILIKDLQDENDTLSSQIMENISEADDLKKELDAVKDINGKLSERCEELQLLTKKPGMQMINAISCPECPLKDELIMSLRSKLKSEPHLKLNRSLSDSDSSSRYIKICTLQNELDASKEDCKKITEEVATIKNHLERSNLSMSQAMDLDESMGDSNIFTFTRDFGTVDPEFNKSTLPKIPEEHPKDIYTLDKINCFNYYVQKTGAEKENLDCDTKIIDVMKMFYTNLVTKHSNEIENLVNKLRDFEEVRDQLQAHISNVTSEYSKITKEIEDKNNKLQTFTNVLSHVKNNINSINEEMSNMADKNEDAKLTNMFKENFLKVIDIQFGLSSANLFESLITTMVNNNQDNINEITGQYTQLHTHMESVLNEFNKVSDQLNQIKSQLSDKENEYNLLKTQKDKIQEICGAVTLDIIKKEQNLKDITTKSHELLLELNVVSPGDFDLTQPLNETVNIVFDHLIKQFKKQNNTSIEEELKSLKKENKHLTGEVKSSHAILEKKQKEIDTFKLDLLEKQNKLQAQVSLQEDLNNIYENKIQENESNLRIIEDLRRDITVLKKTILEKEKTVQTLESEINAKRHTELSESILACKKGDITELMQMIKELTKENDSLKCVHEIIVKEKEACAIELEKSNEIIRRNKVELDRMTSDILVLRESMKDNVSVIESLSLEAKSLLQQNMQLKKDIETKTQNCSRLETNIKTHEKTAEIQSRMIIRLKNQKEEDDKALNEKDKKLDELTEKCLALQKECELIKDSMKSSKEEIDELKINKGHLEARVSELESEVDGVRNHRLSVDTIRDTSRRRRRSLQDSQRMFTEDLLNFEDHNKMEAVFESRGTPDDLFMDVEGGENDGSNRSSPVRLTRGRDSFVSRIDQSDKDEEVPSRPSSVAETRRRRQSIHDLHRATLQHTPSPHDNPLQRLPEGPTDFKSAEPPNGDESEVSQLRDRLACCQQELGELRERYRELDEECDTCAEYLRERDAQCGRLKKDNTALQTQVKELTEKLKSDKTGSPGVAHASVNTDEDWANLHSVVVDRMSFDAEVEKTKRLTKCIEELRYKKQELKNTLAKMQKALEKQAASRENRELEMVRSELGASKQELSELRQRCKELDEECDTCAEYLRERDEQCRKLKEAKTALEARLLEYEEDAAGATHAARRRRQSAHDRNRGPAADLVDASTDTSDDFLSYQVERDVGSQATNDALAREINILKMTLDKVAKEKVAMEHLAAAQMAAVQPAMYVATGSAIVQNQQLTDVMKENQKLKKINAKLIHMCRKRGKSREWNGENEPTTEQG